MVMPGDHVEITVDLINPVACDQGLRFAIREGGRTVGSGRSPKSSTNIRALRGKETATSAGAAGTIPPPALIYTGLAQLVEHWSPKPSVGSSSLSTRAKETTDEEIKITYKYSGGL